MVCRNCAAFEQKLAFHTAPALLGIKCANLIALKKSEFDISACADEFNRKAAAKGLKMKQLCECGVRMLVLVYSERLLAKKLSDSESRELLRKYGYTDDMTLDDCLKKLAERVAENNGEFPHEVGVFLDYPIEDVVGFIKNNGENFKMCGCWKVYGNEETAKRKFENYNKCRKYLCNKLNEGVDIYRALKIS